MKPRPMRALIAKEFGEAVRSRWLAGFVITFCVMALGISVIGTLGATLGGYSGFGRTSATLVNLVLLVVPLMGLTTGAFSLAGEREHGTLTLLLALPLRPAQVFWAKAIGLALALLSALSLAFGIAGMALALRGGLLDATLYAEFFAATLLLAWVSLSIGLWIASRSRRVAPAVGLSLLVWLGLVFAGDLGILGTSLAVRFSPEVLLATASLNPLSLYRILSVDLLNANLEMLGPAGLCAQDLLGRGLLLTALAGLLIWFVVTLGAAYLTYRRDPLRENE